MAAHTAKDKVELDEEDEIPGCYMCHACGRNFKVLKRCKNCRAAYYCSRKCQIQDWPTHRLQCSKQKISNKTEPEVTNQTITSSDGLHNIYFGQDQSQTRREREAEGNPMKCTPASGDHVVITSSNESEQCTTESTDSSSSSCADRYKDPVTITVKTSKQRHRLTLDKHTHCGENLLLDIAKEVRIPLSKMKLIHKGRIMTVESISSVISDCAVFQAIGEVAESEEGLRTKDIDCVMDRMKVDRNTAIKALRETGDVIDAILYLGNL